MIKLFHVTKSYLGDRPCIADLSLTVDKSEFVFLTGPSGAGKTTLLRLIFAAERPTSGQIIVGGRNIARLSASAIPYLRRNIGVVFQDFKLLNNRSVLDNVAFALEVIGERVGPARRRAREMLGRVGLEHKAESPPQRLSGGEQQRVAIARALVNSPAIVLADEPTGNLDASLTADILQLLFDSNARGATIVVATHDRGLLTRFPRRAVQLAHGKMTSDG